MVLKHIDIVNFKNIAEASLDFSGRVNCLLGANGMGKSNLLEAVHFLSFARGQGSGMESRLLRHGSQQLLVKGVYDTDGGVEQTVACGITSGKGKTLRVNGKEYGKLSDHIGKFPIVAVSPGDSVIITEGAEHRRKLMDMVISQCDGAYLSLLIAYNAALAARNRLLRMECSDPLLYESIEARLVSAASALSEKRLRWTEGIAPLVASYYSRITGGEEKAAVAYSSQLLEEPMESVLLRNREKDRALGYTYGGIHRDNLLTTLGTHSMRTVGSQGQVKTFAIALRLAIYDYLKDTMKVKPLLLLDDIFDKLDASRVGRIMEIVGEEGNFGQIFVTDTNRTHLDKIVSRISADRKLLEVVHGEYRELDT